MRGRRRGGEVDFWPAFTDVLAGMLLVMVLVLVFFAVTQTGLVHLAGGKEAALRAMEDQVAELRSLLSRSEDRAEQLRTELLSATELISNLGEQRGRLQDELAERQQALKDEQVRITDLTLRLQQYLDELKDLNAKLVAAEATVEQRESAVSDLQDAVNELRAQLAKLGAELATAESAAQEQTLKVSELLVEMAKKDERITELERLERYTSDFLEKMSEVFGDDPNIRVVGDRFVFQSEVLFASGSAQIGQGGQAELDKFARGFQELQPKLPRDLPVNVQVQGHTDSDKLLTTEQFQDNWELSTARALEVVEYLASAGLPEGMLSAAGFGEHYPRVRGDSAAAKEKNRRIEIRITRR
ncbi:MAG: OmpA family protein [Acidobacteriota bacterium]